MRLINADRLRELYEGSGEYEDDLVVPIKVILQDIDDMPTIATINESVLSSSLKEENLHLLHMVMVMHQTVAKS